MSTAPRVEAAKRDWGHDESGCTVLHIDMDAFYAALELARKPELKGLPVIIGTGNRSVVSAASYEARKYGVNSAMATARARQLCPDGVFLPVDMPYYRAMSRRIFSEVFSQVTDRIERVSVDEGYLDVSAALLRWELPSNIGTWIRAQVAERYRITCSVGIAANKLVAKMASTNAKPDGLLMIPKARHAEFVQMMPLRAIPGVGRSLGERLGAWGVQTVADLAIMNEDALARATRSASAAHSLYLAAHGIDERPVTPFTAEKSIGSESTFESDTRDMRKVRLLLRHCCDKVASALRSRGLMAKTITLKLRFADLSYVTRSRTLQEPVDAESALYPHAVALLAAALGMKADAPETTRSPREIRLAGVSVSALSDARETVTQPSLIDVLEESGTANGLTRSARMREAEHALDTVRRRYGNAAASLGL